MFDNHTLIFLSTLIDCRDSIQNPGLYKDKNCLKYIMDMDILLSFIGRNYILKNKTEKTEEFKKNTLLELLCLVDHTEYT